MEKYQRLSSTISVTEDGNFCAVVVNRNLNVYSVIKNKLTYQVRGTSDLFETKVLKFSPSNETIAWLQTSPDELLIAHVNEEKTSKISAHPDLPFHDVLWSRDGRFLAAFSSLSVFIDIYSVGQGQVSHFASISGAMEDEFGSPLAQFSPDGEYFVTVNISTQGYSITIYNSGDSTWDCVQKMVCCESHAVGGLLWCPDSASLLVWQAGASLRLRLWAADGTVERILVSDDAAVRCVTLSDCGRVAAVLTANSTVRVLDLLTWRLDLTDILVHHPIIHESVARSRLKESGDASSHVSNCLPIKETLYELHQPADLPHRHRALAEFSVDGQYLATYDPTFPSTLWVWQLVDDSLLDTVIALKDDTRVSEFLWHKEESILGANLNNGRLLVWNPEKTVIFNRSDNPWPMTAQQFLASWKAPTGESF